MAVWVPDQVGDTQLRFLAQPKPNKKIRALDFDLGPKPAVTANKTRPIDIPSAGGFVSPP